MGMLAIVGTLLSGVMGAIGAISSANAASASANYQAAVAAQNAQIAKQNAEFERKSGEQQAQTEGLKDKAQIGGIIADEGASGLDITTGSKKGVIGSQQKLATYNEEIIRNNSARKAYDYETQAFNYEAQQGLFKLQASSARTGGMLSAFGSLLGTAGSVGQKWYQYGGATSES